MIKNLLKSENPSISPVSQQPNSLTTNERFVTYYALCIVLSRREKPNLDLFYYTPTDVLLHTTLCVMCSHEKRNSSTSVDRCLFKERVMKRAKRSAEELEIRIVATTSRYLSYTQLQHDDISTIYLRLFVKISSLSSRVSKKKKKKKLKQTKFESPWHRGKMMQMYGNAENV